VPLVYDAHVMRRWLGLLGFCVGSLVVGTRPARAQSVYLQPGDIAVTCVRTSADGVDDLIQITPLVPLAASDAAHRIRYTDLEADEDGVFNEGENILTISVLGGAKNAGQPTMYPTTTLTGPDEQVFLFQGDLDEDTSVQPPGLLLWGFQMSSAGGWASTPTGEVSALPKALASASVAVATNGHTTFAYTGPTTGTRAGLQAAIADSNNWTGDASCLVGLTITEPSDGGTDGEGGITVEGGTDGAGSTGGETGDDAPRDSALSGDADGPAGDGGGDVASGADGAIAGAGGTSGSSGAGGTSGVAGASGAGGPSGVGGASETGGQSGLGGMAGVGGAAGTDGGLAVIDDGGAADGDALADAENDSRGGSASSGCNCSLRDRRGGSAAGAWWIAISALLVCRRRRRRVRHQ
jgi:hypothetical protein